MFFLLRRQALLKAGFFKGINHVKVGGVCFHLVKTGKLNGILSNKSIDSAFRQLYPCNIDPANNNKNRLSDRSFKRALCPFFFAYFLRSNLKFIGE